MKKFVITFLLILANVIVAQASDFGQYKVLKVVDGDTFYVDFNGNNKIDKNEKVRVNGIDTFETKINDGLTWQKKIYKLSTRQALGMGYLAKKYAQKQLLNKTVYIDFSAEQKYDAYNRGLVSVYYNCGKNPSIRSNGIATLNFVHPSEYCRSYEKDVLTEGLAMIYTKSNKAQQLSSSFNKSKFDKNLKNAKKLNLFFYDYLNKKYYDINSPKMIDYSDNNLVVKKGFWYYD